MKNAFGVEVISKDRQTQDKAIQRRKERGLKTGREEGSRVNEKRSVRGRKYKDWDSREIKKSSQNATVKAFRRGLTIKRLGLKSMQKQRIKQLNRVYNGSTETPESVRYQRGLIRNAAPTSESGKASAALESAGNSRRTYTAQRDSFKTEHAASLARARSSTKKVNNDKVFSQWAENTKKAY
jgi:hypothetical protein